MEVRVLPQNCIHASWPPTGNPSLGYIPTVLFAKVRGRENYPPRERVVEYIYIFFLQTAPRDQKKTRKIKYHKKYIYKQ